VLFRSVASPRVDHSNANTLEVDLGLVEFLQLGRSHDGSVVFDQFTRGIGIPLTDGEWWDAQEASVAADRECTLSENNLILCPVDRLSDILKTGIKNCTTCLFGQYENQTCLSGHDRVCVSCTPWSPGTHTITGCTATSDAVFARCQPECPAGSFESVACTESSYRVCQNCSLNGDGEFIKSACLPHNPPSSVGKDAVLDKCTECVLGSTYETVACGANGGFSNRVCSACTPCPGGSYQVKSCSLTNNTQCEPCEGCPSGLTVDRMCGGTLRTKCRPCMQCEGESFMSFTCTPETDTHCDPCTPCPFGHFAHDKCTNISDNLCSLCKTSCPVDEFMSKNCSSDAGDAECTKCKVCENGKFATQLCDSYNNAICKDCDKCPTGFYASGGCKGVQNTTCTLCSVCSVGSLQTEPCAGSQNTECRDCALVENAVFTKEGECDFVCSNGFHKSSDKSSCVACSVCGANEYEVSPCADKVDAICYVRGLVGQLHYLTSEDKEEPGKIDLRDLGFAFNRPVVLVAPPSFNGPTATVARIDRVDNPIGYKVWLAEPQISNVPHTYEYSSYLVLDEGFGANYYVGSIDVTGGDSYTTVQLPDSGTLGPRPWIFQFPQTSYNGPSNETFGFVKTRMSLNGNSATSFDLLLESYEAERNSSLSEMVGYLAMNSGCSETQVNGDATSFTNMCATQYGRMHLNGAWWDYALGITETVAGQNKPQVVSFGKTFKQTPVVFASMQTSRGRRSAELRTRDINKDAYYFIVEEDMTVKSLGHVSEWVAWLAIGHLR